MNDAGRFDPSLLAVLAEVGALAARTDQPVALKVQHRELATELIDATERLRAWLDFVDEGASPGGLTLSAAQVRLQRQTAIARESQAAEMEAILSSTRDEVRLLRERLDDAAAEIEGLEAQFNSPDSTDVEAQLDQQEDELTREEQSLHGEIAELYEHAEKDRRVRLTEIAQSSEALASEHPLLSTAAEALDQVYKPLERVDLGDLRPGALLVRIEQAAKMLQEQSKEAEANADICRDLTSELDALQARLQWERGILQGSARWTELVSSIDAEIDRKLSAANVEVAQLQRSVQRADTHRAAESEWISGEIIGRTILLETLGDWTRQLADENARCEDEIIEKLRQLDALEDQKTAWNDE